MMAKDQKGKAIQLILQNEIENLHKRLALINNTDKLLDITDISQPEIKVNNSNRNFRTRKANIIRKDQRKKMSDSKLNFADVEKDLGVLDYNDELPPNLKNVKKTLLFKSESLISIYGEFIQENFKKKVFIRKDNAIFGCYRAKSNIFIECHLIDGVKCFTVILDKIRLTDDSSLKKISKEILKSLVIFNGKATFRKYALKDDHYDQIKILVCLKELKINVKILKISNCILSYPDVIEEITEESVISIDPLLYTETIVKNSSQNKIIAESMLNSNRSNIVAALNSKSSDSNLAKNFETISKDDAFNLSSGNDERNKKSSESLKDSIKSSGRKPYDEVNESCFSKSKENQKIKNDNLHFVSIPKINFNDNEEKEKPKIQIKSNKLLNLAKEKPKTIKNILARGQTLSSLRIGEDEKIERKVKFVPLKSKPKSAIASPTNSNSKLDSSFTKNQKSPFISNFKKGFSIPKINEKKKATFTRQFGCQTDPESKVFIPSIDIKGIKSSDLNESKNSKSKNRSKIHESEKHSFLEELNSEISLLNSNANIIIDSVESQKKSKGLASAENLKLKKEGYIELNQKYEILRLFHILESVNRNNFFSFFTNLQTVNSKIKVSNLYTTLSFVHEKERKNLGFFSVNQGSDPDAKNKERRKNIRWGIDKVTSVFMRGKTKVFTHSFNIFKIYRSVLKNRVMSFVKSLKPHIRRQLAQSFTKLKFKIGSLKVMERSGMYVRDTERFLMFMRKLGKKLVFRTIKLEFDSSIIPIAKRLFEYKENEYEIMFFLIINSFEILIKDEDEQIIETKLPVARGTRFDMVRRFSKTVKIICEGEINGKLNLRFYGDNHIEAAQLIQKRFLLKRYPKNWTAKLITEEVFKLALSVNMQYPKIRFNDSPKYIIPNHLINLHAIKAFRYNVERSIISIILCKWTNTCRIKTIKIGGKKSITLKVKSLYIDNEIVVEVDSSILGKFKKNVNMLNADNSTKLVENLIDKVFIVHWKSSFLIMQDDECKTFPYKILSTHEIKSYTRRGINGILRVLYGETSLELNIETIVNRCKSFITFFDHEGSKKHINNLLEEIVANPQRIINCIKYSPSCGLFIQSNQEFLDFLDEKKLSFSGDGFNHSSDDKKYIEESKLDSNISSKLRANDDMMTEKQKDDKRNIKTKSLPIGDYQVNNFKKNFNFKEI